MQSESSSLVPEVPNPMPNLPEELIVDILTRLPVKSLLKFRCVSKSWCLWIANPRFIKSHLEKSTKSGNYANHSLLLIAIGCVVTIYTCSLHSILDQNKSPVILNAAELSRKNLYRQLSLFGSCNGIFGILEGYRGLILGNPTIRKSRRLPNSGTNYGKYRIFTYGFGYDEVNDDYKVVEICCFCRHGINRETVVSVYSLRANSWRRIKDYEGGIVSSSPGVFVNGILHWLVIHKEGFNISWSILSLDVSTDAYGELMQPKYDDGDFDPTLGLLQGRLCVFCSYNRVKMDVWMMNEYGKKESWLKFASIPYTRCSRGGVSPLFVSNSGEILLRYGHGLVTYNGRDDKFTNCELKMLGPSFLDTSATYIESLLSPLLDDDDDADC